MIDKKDGAIGSSSFKDSLRLKLNCKVILIHNIDTADGLTNGQLGELIGIVKGQDGTVAKLIVKFNREKVGKKNREKYKEYSKKYPKGVVIEKVSFSYSLTKKASVASSQATLIQFPINVAHAITSHKIQGQTIPKPLKAAFDISSVFDEAQAHVMLSRVEELDQIFILDSLPENKIYANPKALAELHKMNERSDNNNPIPWRQQEKNLLKIVSLNCMNLQNNYKNIINDPTLLESSIIALSETWLEENIQFNIDGYIGHFNCVGPGKGIAVYIKESTFLFTKCVQESLIQLSKFESENIEVIFIYRSEQGNTAELLQHIKENINEKKATVILGDFNICFLANRNNRITKYLEANKFKQLMNEATHIRGRLIDHFYFKEGRNDTEKPSIYRYSPYYSDHDAICVTLRRN